MSPQKRRPQARKGRTAAAAKAGRRRTDRTALIAAIVIVAVGGSLVFAFASAAKQKAEITDSPLSATLEKKLTTIPASVYTTVGNGSADGAPKKISPAVALLKSADGKPRIIYVGAEYCPFCATERWAMVAAFSRFGTFTNLQSTESATTPETYPQTQTLSFYKSTFSSKYITFEPTETETNLEKPLQTPSSEIASLETKYDNGGSIPFIDFANQYFIAGATYDPGLLQGKTHTQIADAMTDPTTDISKGAIGAANGITAAVCAVDNDQPASVCKDPTIQALETSLKSGT
jgi:hypothetical protein